MASAYGFFHGAHGCTPGSMVRMMSMSTWSVQCLLELQRQAFDEACMSHGAWSLDLGLWASGSAKTSAAILTSNVQLLLSMKHMRAQASVMALRCQPALGRAMVFMRLLSLSLSLNKHTDLALGAVE